MKKATDVAIVGMSIYCPGADSINEFWDNLTNGVDSITDAPDNQIDHSYFDKPDESIDKFYCRRGGFTNPFKIDPLQYGILPIIAEGMEPEHLLILGGVEKALSDARIFEKNLSLKKGCIIIGKGNFAGLVAMRAAEVIRNATLVSDIVRDALPNIPEEEIQKIKKEYQAVQGRFQADTAIGTMPNLVASMAANKFDIQGPAYTVDAACASGLLAVDHCINLLNNGQCDIAIAGGMHTVQSAMFWSVFNMMGALSKKQVISPFSEDADGLLIGQGLGVMVLKKLDKAIEDKDRIYAVIKGIGVCSDGGGSHVMVTSVQGQKRALDLAWKNAELNPKNIGYVETHGTGTPLGDKTEVGTLTDFFGDNSQPRAYLGSVKSNIGHTMPASGMIGLIKTALSLYHKKIPKTLHCEKPLKAMFDSRFRPSQELIDWDESKYPLIAGVNAFGFGGINSHAVLTAYDNETEHLPVKKVSTDKVIVLSAATKEDLIKKLDEANFTLSEGDYRLVVFKPTPERINLAKKVIAKDKPWKGFQDIWFSNDPLLKSGEKIAFLAPGINVDVALETHSISDFFDLPRIDYEKIKSSYEELGDNDGFLGMKLFFSLYLNDIALKKLGVIPDMYAGHSIGEWYAARAAGLISDETLSNMTFSITLGCEEPDEEVFYLAVVAGYKKMKPFCDSIPGLYLAVDNSTNHVILCATKKARKTLVEILNKESIFCIPLPFKSGFHTPLAVKAMESVSKALEEVELFDDSIPVWSGNSLCPYPKDKEGFTQLVKDNITKPLYFYELIDKMYEEENARVFIQIGAGSLTEFISDTLKNRPHSVIVSASPQFYGTGAFFEDVDDIPEDDNSIITSSMNHTGLEQIRRVIALLFVEGKAFLDLTILDVEEQKLSSNNLITLPVEVPMIRNFPLLKEAVKKHYSQGFSATPVESAENLILQAMNENIQDMNKGFQDMVAVQDEITQLFSEKISFNQTVKKEVVIQNQEDKNNTSNIVPIKRKGIQFEEPFYITLEDHPYLLDHAIIRQPKNWKYTEDLNPVIPMTMILELFAEIAHRQVPSRKIVKIGPAMVMKWVSVEKPFDEKIIGQWKTEDTVFMEIKGYANVEITFGDEYPNPPEEYEGTIDIGKEIMPPISKREVYDRYTFHGAAYMPNIKIRKIAERGIISDSQKTEGKGSLLDGFGQALGLFLHLTETINMISFPIRLKEICFYQDMYDQEGIFEQTTIIKSISDNFEIGDVVLKREGKLWAVAKAWVGQRFEFDERIWHVILKPNKYKIAIELAPNVHYYDNTYNKISCWMFLCKRYLNYPEKQYLDTLSSDKQKKFLIDRVALKDAVRSFIRKEDEDFRFPIEIFVEQDSSGKTQVHGGFFEGLDKVEVSLAHKQFESVAIVSNKPVGIDIELIEDREQDFYDLYFTKNELNLLKDKNTSEWVTRFWVAKKAYSKMIDTELNDNLKQYEIEHIEGENLFIHNIEIQTINHKDKYIVGWTK